MICVRFFVWFYVCVVWCVHGICLICVRGVYVLFCMLSVRFYMCFVLCFISLCTIVVRVCIILTRFLDDYTCVLSELCTLCVWFAYVFWISFKEKKQLCVWFYILCAVVVRVLHVFFVRLLYARYTICVWVCMHCVWFCALLKWCVCVVCMIVVRFSIFFICLYDNRFCMILLDFAWFYLFVDCWMFCVWFVYVCVWLLHVFWYVCFLHMFVR